MRLNARANVNDVILRSEVLGGGRGTLPPPRRSIVVVAIAVAIDVEPKIELEPEPELGGLTIIIFQILHFYLHCGSKSRNQFWALSALVVFLSGPLGPGMLGAATLGAFWCRVQPRPVGLRPALSLDGGSYAGSNSRILMLKPFLGF